MESILRGFASSNQQAIFRRDSCLPKSLPFSRVNGCHCYFLQIVIGHEFKVALIGVFVQYLLAIRR